MPNDTDTDTHVNFLVNLDAARAQRAEAGGNRHRVQLGHELFDFPGVKDWPVEITDHLKNGDLNGALGLLLAHEDRERFFAQKPTMADLDELFTALGKASGVGDLGN